MSDDTQHLITSTGDKIWNRFVEETRAEQIPEFESLLDIRTVDGHGGSSCKVFEGDRVSKGSMLSISMGPMGRYLTIHLIPSIEYDVPRLVFEGMLSPKGSQVSLDLFPDKDIVMGYEAYIEKYEDLIPVYNEARANRDFVWENSRVPFMRTLFSPFALLAFNVMPEQLPVSEDLGEAYLDHWLKMLKAAKPLNMEEQQIKFHRRIQMKEMMRAGDPDRPGVVAVFGEETTSAIEEASML
jgi:hypothetical protein